MVKDIQDFLARQGGHGDDIELHDDAGPARRRGEPVIVCRRAFQRARAFLGASFGRALTSAPAKESADVGRQRYTYLKAKKKLEDVIPTPYTP